MMTQKGVPYVQLFGSLSGVILVFCMSLYLNILCTSSVKQYYTENDKRLFQCGSQEAELVKYNK